MVGYSPISSRNHRIAAAPPYHISATANSAVQSNIAGAGAAAAAATGATVSNTFHGNLSGSSRRRESMNSSIGATSIRRLLTVNRGCRHRISLHVRAKVAKNFTLLILAHGLMCAVLVPLFGLQVNKLSSIPYATYCDFVKFEYIIFCGFRICDTHTQASNSMWFHQETWLLRKIGPNVGPLLLSLCCFITSGTSLLTIRLVKKLGNLHLFIAHYAILCIFLLIHLYPTIWLLMPAYGLLGLTLGPTWICKFNLIVLFASRISCGQHECPTATTMMNESSGMDEHKNFCNRNERVRRLSRWFHAAQDLGILFGAIIASIIISCAATESNCILTQQLFKLNRNESSSGGSSSSSGGNDGNVSTMNNFPMNTLNDIHRGIDTSHLSTVNFLLANKSKSIIYSDHSGRPTAESVAGDDESFGDLIKYYQESFFSQHNELLDSLFNTDEHGDRICGASSCPIWNREFENTNSTEEYDWFRFSGTIPMTLVYIVLGVIALVLVCLSHQYDSTFKYDNFKRIHDTLLLASPMAFFIGIEQAYVIGGFTRVCKIFCNFLQLFIL